MPNAGGIGFLFWAQVKVTLYWLNISILVFPEGLLSMYSPSSQGRVTWLLATVSCYNKYVIRAN